VHITRSSYTKDKYYGKVKRAMAELLKEESEVKPIEVFRKMGNLTKDQIEDWRFGRVPALERVISGSLPKIHRILMIIKFHAEAQGLTPSKTAYRRWGKKGHKRPLQFSKTGQSWMEDLYSTHYRRTHRRHRRATDAPSLLIREGKPSVCIACGKPLHAKSEYYCSKVCSETYSSEKDGQEVPAFLSKWKLRKRKEARDPSVKLRQKTRAKTNDLIRQGRLRKAPCEICHAQHVVPHHEDYTNPFKVRWLCEEHHKAYHNGEIALQNGTLWWNPERLIPQEQRHMVPKKKYQKLQDDYRKMKEKSI
jgi:hypothetical protein